MKGARGARGRRWLYWAACGLLLVAAGLLGFAARGLLESIGLLQLSATVSFAAIVAAILSVVLRAPRER